MFDLNANKILNYMTLSSNDFTKLYLPQSDLIGDTTAHGCNHILHTKTNNILAKDAIAQHDKDKDPTVNIYLT